MKTEKQRLRRNRRARLSRAGMIMPIVDTRPRCPDCGALLIAHPEIEVALEDLGERIGTTDLYRIRSHAHDGARA